MELLKRFMVTVFFIMVVISNDAMLVGTKFCT